MNLKRFGENHDIVTRGYNALGKLYKRLGSLSKSIENFDRCIGIRARIHGWNHVDTLRTLDYLADVCEESGDDEKAVWALETIHNSSTNDRRIYQYLLFMKERVRKVGEAVEFSENEGIATMLSGGLEESLVNRFYECGRILMGYDYSWLGAKSLIRCLRLQSLFKVNTDQMKINALINLIDASSNVDDKRAALKTTRETLRICASQCGESDQTLEYQAIYWRKCVDIGSPLEEMDYLGRAFDIGLEAFEFNHNVALVLGRLCD
jgi:predicted DNA-binding transcriptional regulator